MRRLHPSLRRALVTGVSRGLGKVLAEDLLGCGLEVAGTSRNWGLLSEEPKLLGVRKMELDVASAVKVEDFIVREEVFLREVDLLINNAGEGLFGSFENLPPEEVQKQIQLLLLGPMRLTQAVLPCMKKRGFGVIVNVSSLAGRLPMTAFAPYNAAKAGLSAFSQSLMQECQGSGVNIIDFQPGDLRTPFNENVLLHKTDGLEGLWDRQNWLISNAPLPETASMILLKTLIRPRNREVRAGSFVQRHLAPMAAEILPQTVLRWMLRRHFSGWSTK
jgi:short-subunit dehydrogenase